MRDSQLARLLHICTPASECAPSEQELQQLRGSGEFGGQLADVLVRMNGFYGYESALHFFPSTSKDEFSIFEWNTDRLWRNAYGQRADNLFFFAEDVFGGQFCAQNNVIRSFDPETGEMEFLCGSLEEWATLMLEQGNFYTGYPLAHEWQVQNGPLVRGRRLVPRIPFVCGGAFESCNLHSLDAVQGMLYRADIARKIADHPDGTSLTLNLF